MISGSIQEITSLNKNINIVLEYLKKYLNSSSSEYQNLINQPAGFINMITLSDSIYILEQVYTTKDRANCLYESHLKYLDIHYIVDGYETLEVEDISDLTIVTSYNEQKDATKYHNQTSGTVLTLHKHDIGMFYPKDGHMTGITLKQPNKVIKIVGKILI